MHVSPATVRKKQAKRSQPESCDQAIKQNRDKPVPNGVPHAPTDRASSARPLRTRQSSRLCLGYSGTPPPLLDHRWRAVQKLMANCCKPMSVVDALAKAVVSVLPKIGDGTMTKQELLAAIRSAMQLRETDKHADREDLEAWLLTGWGVNEIADKTGLSPVVVQIYRDLYFDVVPWMERFRFQLALEVLPMDVHGGIDEKDSAAMKRFVALQGGPFVFDRYLEYLRALPIIVPSRFDQCTTEELRRFEDLLWMKIYVMSHLKLKTQAQRLRQMVVLEWSRNLRQSSPESD